jgi:hypothetical protein
VSPISFHALPLDRLWLTLVMNREESSLLSKRIPKMAHAIPFLLTRMDRSVGSLLAGT